MGRLSRRCQARYVGQVVAGDADAATELAALDFKTDAWKLIAVRCWEVAGPGVGYIRLSAREASLRRCSVHGAPPERHQPLRHCCCMGKQPDDIPEKDQ